MIGWILLGLLATLPAMAEPQPSIDIIRWEAPPGCPQESDVRDRIQKLLGSGRHDSHLRAEGTITRMDRRFRLDLVVRVGDVVGTRSIESNSCEDLAGAAVVELGLLIHSGEAAPEPGRPGTLSPTSPPARGSTPSRARSDGADTHPSQETSDASPEQQVTPESKTEVQSEAREQPPSLEPQPRIHALVQAPVVELGVGPLPQLARGIGLSLGLEYAKWQSQLRAIYWQRQNVPAPAFPGCGADVGRIGAAFWVCREFRHSWFGFSPCLTAGLERVSVSGTGRNVAPSTQHSLGITAGAGVQSRLYLSRRIRLLVALAGQAELSRPQISIAGERPAYQFAVYQFAPAALSVALGLEWIF
jgi:hypothetical protein